MSRRCLLASAGEWQGGNLNQGNRPRSCKLGLLYCIFKNSSISGMNHVFAVISSQTFIFITSTLFELCLPLQVSEREMDEAITCTTHQDSTDASSSHVTGSSMFPPNALFQMQEDLRTCSWAADINVLRALKPAEQFGTCSHSVHCRKFSKNIQF